MNNENVNVEVAKDEPSFLALILLGFFFGQYCDMHIPDNIKNLIEKYQNTPEELLENEEINKFVYAEYNRLKNSFYETRNMCGNKE